MALRLNAEYNRSLKSASDRMLSHPKFADITSKRGPEGRDLDQKLHQKDTDERGFHQLACEAADGSIVLLSGWNVHVKATSFAALLERVLRTTI